MRPRPRRTDTATTAMFMATTPIAITESNHAELRSPPGLPVRRGPLARRAALDRLARVLRARRRVLHALVGRRRPPHHRPAQRGLADLLPEPPGPRRSRVPHP